MPSVLKGYVLKMNGRGDFLKKGGALTGLFRLMGGKVSRRQTAGAGWRGACGACGACGGEIHIFNSDARPKGG